MGFSSAKMSRCFLVTWVALAAAYSAGAQQAEQRHGEAILFSSPDDSDASTNMPSLAAKPPGSLDFANAIQSPGLNMNTASQAGAPVGSQLPVISPGQALQIQQLLAQKKKWTQDTPEGILNLPNQRKIFGLEDQDASGRSDDDTSLSGYFNGQNQSQSPTNNDYSGLMHSLQPTAFSGDQPLQINPDIGKPANFNQGNQSVWSQPFNPTPNNQPASLLTPDSDWKPFSQPAPLSMPVLGQQADMEAFLKLLQPHSQTDSAKTTPFGDRLFSRAVTPPATEPPTTIPIGQSYAPLSAEVINMPVGVPSLPGLFSSTNAPNAPLPAYAPDWKPQAPPWTSTAPQLGTVPQRKF